MDGRSDGVALLFTDIEGSTRLLERLGSEAYADVLGQHHQLLRDAITASHGEERGTEGDSFFVIFDRGSDAVGAAVAAQRSLAAAAWPDGASVKVRMGIHVGHVARSGDNVVGMAIHMAARIMSAAHGGQIVVSDACAAGVGMETLRDLGRHRLKDIEGPVRLFQVDHDGAHVEFPALRSLPSGMTPVPGYLTALIGREKERAQLTDLAKANRMVTITGPPGVGKTRLAVAVALDVAGAAGDVAFVDLAPLARDEDVPARIAAALAVPVRPNESSTSAVLRELPDAGTLVVLDNCEHIAGGVADFLAAVLSRCPRLRALATSREPLAIEGEIAWQLEPLDAAVELFVSRARAASPALDLSTADPDVVAICERLDRLPLAVELAASLVPTMAPAEIRSRLDDRFSILENERRDVPGRHRTLDAAIGWSYQLLRPEEQSCLRRLSVFRGSFDLEVAESVGQASVSVLNRLRSRSLVSVVTGPGPSRYRLLETIRAYAAEALAASGEEDATRAAHAAAFAARAAQSTEHGPALEDELGKLDVDVDNFMAALAWLGNTDPAAGLRLALAVEGLFRLRLDATESTKQLESLLARATDASDLVRGGALGLLADIYRNSGRFADARRCAEQGHRLGAEAMAITRGSPTVLLGQILGMQGELERAAALFEQRLVVARAHGMVNEELMVLRELANVAIERVDPDTALLLLDEADDLASRSNVPWLGGILGWDRGRVLVAHGDLEAARSCFESSLAQCEQFGIVRGIAGNSLRLASVARLEGSFTESRELADEAMRIFRSVGDVGGVAHVVVERALLASARAEHADALRLLGAAAALRDELGIVTPGSEVSGIDGARTAAAAALGATATERLVAEGRSADLEVLLSSSANAR